jgi:two-component system sensor histidine kinase VanS
MIIAHLFGRPVRLLTLVGPVTVISLLILSAIGIGGGWFLAGRMLAPLARIAVATRRAAAGSLSHRIEMEGPGDEFRELADSFDDMLARLEAQTAEQQRFAANASHELRTPLAITQTLLDVARQDPDHDDRELIERLRLVNARAIDLTEALLLLSRADQGAFGREDVELSLLAEEAAETLLPLAEKRGITIETTGQLARTTGSRALLLQLTTNLLHNAIVHNLPDGGRVTVATTADAERVALVVENTGEQLSPPLVATFTEPFQRGTQRTRSDHAGVGLGLAIVKSIARAHGGSLALVPGAAGGLRVTVTLPAAPPPAS